MLNTVQLVLGGAIVVAVLGWFGHYKLLSNKVESLEEEIVQYQRRNGQLVLERDQLRQEFTEAVIGWNEQVKNQERRLEEAKRDKEKIIKKHREDFSKIFKANQETRKEINEAVQTLPTGTIVAPTYFRMFYNISAVGGPETRSGPGSIRVPEVPKGTLGAPETLDSNSVTKVVVENNLNCKDTHDQLNKLIDVVEELEARNERINARRSDGAAEATGRNVSSGTTQPN